jgi:hypothetical protein
VLLPEGEHVHVTVPDLPAAWQRRLAALDAFEAACTELTEEQWRLFDEAVQRRPVWEPLTRPMNGYLIATIALVHDLNLVVTSMEA